MWDEPPSGLDDTVVAAIARESAATPIESRRRPVGRVRWWSAAAAAAVAIIIVGAVLTTRGGGLAGDVSVALAATDAAPGASGEAALSTTPAGLKILLDTDGLGPAPDGFFYEAWVSNGEIRVSCGSFHLRNGRSTIELWAGVVDPSFDTLAVTLEPVDGETDSSGDVRLRGSYRLDD
jgi:hypothetical protein